MKKVAVILAGCGVFDGAEINEVVLTLLALEQAGLAYQALAPDRIQATVVDHVNSAASEDQRNILQEAARIVRGEIQPLAMADPIEYDALIIPGGFGAVQNLCDFAQKGRDMTVADDVLKFGQAMFQAGKPLGFICIAPVMIPAICGEGIQLTIGNAANVIENIGAMGGRHIECAVDGIVSDDEHKVVSTPAYMLASSISEAKLGIDKLVQRIAGWVD